MRNLLFYFALSTLLAHELDAITHAEWRLLWILRNLPEPTAANIFVLAHIPLLAGILWLTHSANERIHYGSRIAVSIFLVIHAGLHKLLDHHPLYSFDTSLSLGLIYGGGVLGAAYLGTVLLGKGQTANERA